MTQQSTFHRNVLQEMQQKAKLLPADTVVLTGRKSQKNESSTKSLNDQFECCMEIAQDLGIPASEERWWCEAAGHGGDEWWEGGGSTGLVEDTRAKGRTRPVLTKIIRGIMSGTVKCVIVYSLDRLWRSAAIAGVVIDIFANYGCLLVDRNGLVDIFSAEGRAHVLNNAVNAQNAREHAVVAAPRGVMKSRDKGKLVGPANSLGFRSVGGKTGRVRHIEEEQEVVNRIFRLYLVGENGCGPLSTDKIAHLLMAEEYIWTPDLHEKRAIVRSDDTRKLIYDKQINSTLKDVRYIGLQRSYKETYPCPAFLKDGGKTIVPEDMFYSAQAKLQEQSRGSRSTVNRHPLSGRVRCALCGLPLGKQVITAELSDGTTEKRAFWLSRRVYKMYWCQHKLPCIRVEKLDEYIDSALLPLLLAEVRDKAALGGELDAEAKTAKIQRDLDQRVTWLENRLPEMVAQVEFGDDGLFDVETLKATAKRVRSEVEKLRADLRATLVKPKNWTAETLDRLRELSSLPEATRRDGIRSVIRWIAVLPSEEAVLTEKGRMTKPANNMGTFVFLTAWGTYHSARLYRQAESGGYGEKNRLLIRPATLGEAVGGVADFPNPDEFFGGLERSWKGRAYEFNPRDVAPGYTPGNTDMTLSDAVEEIIIS